MSEYENWGSRLVFYYYNYFIQFSSVQIISLFFDQLMNSWKVFLSCYWCPVIVLVKAFSWYFSFCAEICTANASAETGRFLLKQVLLVSSCIFVIGYTKTNQGAHRETTVESTVNDNDCSCSPYEWNSVCRNVGIYFLLLPENYFCSEVF